MRSEEWRGAKMRRRRICKGNAKPIPLFYFSKKEGGPLPKAMVGGTKIIYH